MWKGSGSDLEHVPSSSKDPEATGASYWCRRSDGDTWQSAASWEEAPGASDWNHIREGLASAMCKKSGSDTWQSATSWEDNGPDAPGASECDTSWPTTPWEDNGREADTGRELSWKHKMFVLFAL